MNFFFKWVSPILVLFVGIGGVAALFAMKPEVEQNEDKRQIAALNVAAAEQKQIKVSVKTQGEVRSRTDIQLTPEVAGRIVEVHPAFAEGGAFTPDTVLAKIDDAQYRLAVTRAEASVAEAAVSLERELADAAIKAKQWKDYVSDGKPTPLALNKPQVAQAQARLRAAEADLAEARLNLARTEIKLPFSGRVVERMVGLGQYVGIATNLGRVFATDVAEVRLPLTDRQLGELNLTVGFDAERDQVAVPVTLRAEMGGKPREWTGRIIRTQASIDNQTRLFYAIAEVEKPYEPAAGKAPLPVGLFVEAEIESAREMNAIVVPRLALRGENTIYTVEEDETLRIREVAILSTSSTEVLITDGIAAGSSVVTSPVRNPSNGMKVRVVTAVADNGDTTQVLAADTDSAQASR